MNEVLDRQAADGGRATPKMGAGAETSGQAHLWAEWHRMRPDARAKLLEQMLKVLIASGGF